MKFSSAQLQLLSRLNIDPLLLHSDFAPGEPVPSSVDNAVVYPDMSHPLAQDISLLLQALSPSFTWQLDKSINSCCLEGTVLTTPELQLLQQPSLKKQLWKLLQQVV